MGATVFVLVDAALSEQAFKSWALDTACPSSPARLVSILLCATNSPFYVLFGLLLLYWMHQVY